MVSLFLEDIMEYTYKFLTDDQLESALKLKSGNILVGGTGAGKSRCAIAWWYMLCGGEIDQVDGPKRNIDISDDGVRPLYIITTAKKRNEHEWDSELLPFSIITGDKVIVDSWNNIGKYVGITGSVFIFDEDHLTGSGAWVHAFWKIAANNTWIVATATPGDKWMDFYPIFKANGFFKSKREFEEHHVIYNPYKTFPDVLRYVGEGRLNMYRRRIVVQMKYEHRVNIHDEFVECTYDKATYNNCEKFLYNPYSDNPIESGSGLCYCLRRICNSDRSRLTSVLDIIEEGEAKYSRTKYIIFYSFNYELDILRTISDYLDGYEIAEYNGQVHDILPDSGKWIYLVNYGSGSEAWNCITTDTIIFYSQTYSYKTLVQAKGRIDRRNTPFWELYYYHLRSNSKIDKAISYALMSKKEFNERDYYGKRFKN